MVGLVCKDYPLVAWLPALLSLTTWSHERSRKSSLRRLFGSRGTPEDTGGHGMTRDDTG